MLHIQNCFKKVFLKIINSEIHSFIFNFEHEVLIETLKENKGLIDSSKPTMNRDIAIDPPKCDPISHPDPSKHIVYNDSNFLVIIRYNGSLLIF